MGSISRVVRSSGGVATASVEITLAESDLTATEDPPELRQLGDIDGSSKAVMQAQTMFIRLGQRRGLIAMQRIRKGGLSSLLA
jgi:hypothetical protein